MNNPNQHITEFLNYYCDMSTAPQYAVMLKGKWGSGKTHFINDYKEKLNEKNKKYIYVSLYGVTSYDEIETKFLEVLHPKLYNKKTILAGKIAKGLLKATLKVDLDDDGTTDGTVTGQIPNLNMKDLLNTQDRILIFDDLERCSIKINDLLGYINYFVEHQDYKVILLANEEELEKDDKFKNIKEKLIGKTFEVVSNTELAYDSFIKEIKENNLFTDNKNEIITIYKQSGYENLRVFRQVILDFNRLSEIIELEKFKIELIRDFIKVHFILAIESRFQKYKILEIDEYYSIYINLFYSDNETEKNKIEKSNYHILTQTYNIEISNNHIISLPLWNDIINNSIINTAKIQQELNSSIYYNDTNITSWKKLWHYSLLNDSEFEKNLASVKKEITDCTYTELPLVMLISSKLIEIYEDNLDNIDINHLIKLIKRQIDSLFKNNYIEEQYIFNITSSIQLKTYKTLGFKNSSQYYDKIKIYIKEKLEIFEKEILIKEASKLYKLLKNNSGKFYTNLTTKERDKLSLKDKPVLQFLDIEVLIDILFNESGYCRYYLGGVLEERYEQDHYNKSLVNEIGFLLQLQSSINNQLNLREGKVSAFNVKKDVVKQLDKAISDLQTYIDNNKDKNEIQ